MTLLGNTRVVATVQGADNDFRLTNDQGDHLDYLLYADMAHTEPLSKGRQFDFTRFQGLDVLGLFGGADNSIMLYAATHPATGLSAGTYTDTLQVLWDYNICRGIGLLGLCIGREKGTKLTQLTLALQVTPDCRIEAPDVHFGSAPLAAGFAPVEQTLHLYCTAGSAYQVGLSMGNHAQGNQRYMANGSERLAYNLFKPTGSIWGDIDTGQARHSADADNNAATPSDGGPDTSASRVQSFNYRAVIDPRQPTPSAGTYTDQIIVTVRF